MSFLTIKASDIEGWTDSEPRRAQELLPKLIWKLIMASSKSVRDIHFAFDSAIQYSGYDGYLETDDLGVFFPDGKSVWEFGTNKNIKSKFESDYKKRTDNPNGIDISNTTICMVTSRSWYHKEGISEFTNRIKSDGKWKNVRVLDANSLEMWLNECPSVLIWFSGIIGKDITDLLDLESYWHSIVDNTSPRLNTDFFRIGREDTISSKIIDLIEKDNKHILLCSDSKIEGILTLASELLDSQETSHKQFLSRIIVALSSSALINASQNYENAIVIPAFNNEKMTINNKCTVVIPTESEGPIIRLYKNSPKCVIEKRRRKNFILALEKLGFDINDSNSIANDTKCRFSPLFRRITNDINYKIPEWYNNTETSKLVPALLARNWEGTCEGDKEILELLSGMEYDDYINCLHPFTESDDAPIFMLDNSFACISVEELWDVLYMKITPGYFKKYKECVRKVFTEIDPKYDLPEEKWQFASLYGKHSRYSEDLKIGLLYSLVKLVELGETDSSKGFSVNSDNECKMLVKQIFDEIKTKDEWLTICHYIDCFVEAAPEIVLNEIQKQVADDNSNFWCLFKKRESFLFPTSYCVNIFFALEKMLWIEQYCARIINVLVMINEKKIEYATSNTPIDTLYKYFCLFYNQGALTIEEKQTLFEKIIKDYPYTGKQLVEVLLPSGSRTTVGLLADFKWKQIEKNEFENTGNNQNNPIVFVIGLFLREHACTFEDWKIIIDNYALFRIEANKEGINLAQQITMLSENDKLKLCSFISHKIGHNRQFANSDWSLSEDILKELENIYESILSDSPKRIVHYFSYDFVGLKPYVYDEKNYKHQEAEKALLAERINGLECVLDQFGFDCILEIASSVPDVRILANTLLSTKYLDYVTIDCLKCMFEKVPEFVNSIVTELYYKKGISFFESLIEDKSEFVKNIIGQLPATEDVIEFVDKLDLENQIAYWETVNMYSTLRNGNVYFCLKKLLEFNRPYSTLHLLNYYDDGDSEIIIESLQKSLEMYPNKEKDGMSLDRIRSFEIGKLFTKLYGDNEIDKYKVSQLEFGYFHLFDHDFEPKCFIDIIFAEPALFVEFISCVYKNDELEFNDPLNGNKKIAETIFSLFSIIKRVPGQSGKDINVDILSNWIDNVRKIAEEKHYTRACDMQIGMILSYVPIDEDGIWPHKALRGIIEKGCSEVIKNNIVTQYHNQRGVHNITGGDDEEKLSEKYFADADRIRVEYPNTASMLYSIGETYKSEARAERNRELKGYY